MKRNLLSILFLLLICSCEKNSGYYNEDGSLVTRDQAIELTEEMWQMFDCAFISAKPLKPKTPIKQSFVPTYYTPNYQSWMVVMYNAGVNTPQCHKFVFVNAKTGAIFIEPEFRTFPFEEDGDWWGFKYPSDLPTPVLHYARGKEPTVWVSYYTPLGDLARAIRSGSE